MNVIYEYNIEESFSDGVIEKISSDGAFMMVYMEDYSEPEFFIMTETSIKNLKEIELIEYEDYGIVKFKIGFDSNTSLEEGDYFDIFEDDRDVLGSEVSYKVSLKNLQALKENISQRNARVIAYSCKDKEALENQFYRWFYSSYKDDLHTISKSSEVFTKPENYKDSMKLTIRIAADNIIESNILTFWDAIDVERIHKDPNDLENEFKNILEFKEVKEFVPVLF